MRHSFYVLRTALTIITIDALIEEHGTRDRQTRDGAQQPHDQKNCCPNANDNAGKEPMQ